MQTFLFAFLVDPNGNEVNKGHPRSNTPQIHLLIQQHSISLANQPLVPFRMKAQVDQKFDGYRLLRFLGRGGFGEVWLCQSEAMGDYRALKIIPRDSDAILQKEYEALLHYRNASAALRSPHLLTIEHVNLIDLGLFYVMPLADGVGAADPREPKWLPLTLAQKIHERRNSPAWFSSAEIVALMLPILSALQTLTDAGLVHRDVKPDNILFFQGKPCLGDISLLGQDKAELTQRGTPGYMTPSWYIGGLPDMYGAAATLYHLLTGNEPDKMGRSAFHWPPQGEKALSASERVQWIKIHDVIRRACEQQTGERFFDFTAFSQALTLVVATKCIDKPTLPNNQSRKKNSSRILLRFVASIALLFVTCVFAIVFLTQRDQQKSKTVQISQNENPEPAKTVDSAKEIPAPTVTKQRLSALDSMSKREQIVSMIPFILYSSGKKQAGNLDFELGPVIGLHDISKSFRSRDYRLCLNHLEKYIQHNPELETSPRCQWFRACLLKSQGQNEEAEKVVNPLLDEYPIDHLNTVKVISECATELHHDKYALDLMTRAIEKAPYIEKVEYYYQKSRVQIFMGDYHAALQTQIEALAIPVKQIARLDASVEEAQERHENTVRFRGVLLRDEFPEFREFCHNQNSR